MCMRRCLRDCCLACSHLFLDESVRYAKYVVADTSDGDSDDGQASTSAYNFASLTSTVSKWTRSAVSTTTLQKFGVENTVFVFLSLLAEKRIIVTGANVSILVLLTN